MGGLKGFFGGGGSSRRFNYQPAQIVPLDLKCHYLSLLVLENASMDPRPPPKEKNVRPTNLIPRGPLCGEDAFGKGNTKGSQSQTNLPGRACMRRSK